MANHSHLPLSQPLTSERLNDLYGMLFRFDILGMWRRDVASRSNDEVDRSCVLYQRLLPPRGAELEEVKPPSNVLVSPISRWNGVKKKGLSELTTSSTSTATAVSTSSVATTSATSAVSGHLSKSRVNLLLGFSENGY